MNLSLLDKSIIVIYLAMLLLVSLYITSRFRKKMGLRDYFLANRSLPWWMVGFSTFAVNVSAEHFVSMNNAAYHMGVVLISYEWIAALTLVLVAKCWLPLCFNRGVYTLSQLLQQRISRKARMVMAGYWITFYALVVLTGLFWISTTSIQMMTGLDYPSILAILWLFAAIPVLSSGIYGLSWLDVLNVGLMIVIGVTITLCLLELVSTTLGTTSMIQTLGSIYQQHTDKFELLLDPGDTFYHEMPKISVLVGGMWILNLHFWGLYQPNMQRMLCGRTLKDCQQGALLAACLKTFLPLIIILPGVLVMVLAQEGSNQPPAYDQLYNLLPSGVKGLAVVSIIAASLSSISSVALSVSTLFTLDLYAANEGQSAHSSLWVAKVSAIVALSIAALLTIPLMSGWHQGFFLAQLLGGILTPAVLVIFISVFLFKATNSLSLVMPVVTSILCALSFNQFFPNSPFLHQIEITFLLCLALSYGARLISSNPRCIQLDNDISIGSTSHSFNLAASIMSISIFVGYWYFA